MSRSIVEILCLFACCLTGTGLVLGSDSKPVSHPVSVIEADVFVTKFMTTMRLKCFAEDLELLQGVEALDDGFYDSEELRDATADHADYLAERIHLIGVDGNRFPATVVEVVDFEIPNGERVRQGELMKYTIGVVLEFKYEKPPEFLTINQQIIAEGLLLPSELKILLKQEGSDEPYFQMMKPDQPETFRFDWNNPLPDSDATDEQRESWFEQQREQSLGITSYSSVYSFIYITNYEVRHEVLIPLATLNTFFEIERAEESFLDISEQDVVATKVKALFASGNDVEIDNVVVAPVFDRIDFYGLDLRDFAIQAERRKVSMANGRVGIIMSYSTKGIPRDVKVTWDKFNDSVKTVDSVVIAFDKVEKAEFSMFLEDNTFHWTSSDRQPPTPITEVTTASSEFKKPQLDLPIYSLILAALAIPLIVAIPFSRRYLAVSVIAAMLVGGCWLLSNYRTTPIDHPFARAPEIPDATAADIFEQLHKNMFRAFDYHSENEIYDALARSVHGELLQKLYLEITDSLRISEQGGAISRVEQVNLIDGSKISDLRGSENTRPSDSRPAFQFKSKWEVVGTVEHWGHIHERNNKYDANFKIELIDSDWKITKMSVKDFAHGPVKTRPRKL